MIYFAGGLSFSSGVERGSLLDAYVRKVCHFEFMLRVHF